MLVKLICTTTIVFCTWFFGISYSQILRDRVKLVDSYVFFLTELKSAITYSGKNIYDFLSENKQKYTRSISEFLILNKDAGIKKTIKDFKCSNNDEQKCVDLISDLMSFIENSSDINVIADLIDLACQNIDNYKKQIQEEYKGKIKIAPSISLICGLFIALVLI